MLNVRPLSQQHLASPHSTCSTCLRLQVQEASVQSKIHSWLHFGCHSPGHRLDGLRGRCRATESLYSFYLFLSSLNVKERSLSTKRVSCVDSTAEILDLHSPGPQRSELNETVTSIILADGNLRSKRHVCKKTVKPKHP